MTFFTQQAAQASLLEEGMSLEEIAEDYVAPAQHAVCEAVQKDMKAQLQRHREFALISGYDWFMKFSLGRSTSGRWMGFFVPVSDVGFMCDYENDGWSPYS